MSEPARPGRARSAEVDHRIADAVLGLLRAGGPTAVTMEAVATRSGVAKTTVYRRHRDRQDLLRAVVRGAMGTPGDAPDVPVRERVRWALGRTWTQMADVLGPGGLAAIVADTEPAFTREFRAALEPYVEAMADQVRADAAAGRLRRDLDADAAVTLFVGAYLGELVRRGSVDDAWLERCLDLMWVAIAADLPG